MRKIKSVLCIATLLSFFALSVNAAVTFLPNAGGGVGSGKKTSGSNHVSPEQKCRKSGYFVSRCKANQNAVDPCPYNKSYFKFCCDKEYNYTAKECINAGLLPSKNKCGGLHKCI
mgnify:CR=1 FL=1